VAWPDVVEIDEDGGRVQVTWRVSRVRFPGLDRARLAVRIPSDAETLTLAELREAIESMGAF
jgi:hypothetical protein